MVFICYTYFNELAIPKFRGYILVNVNNIILIGFMKVDGNSTMQRKVTNSVLCQCMN